MSFADTFKKKTEPHVDTPAQAEARSKAAAEVKAKADAKAARNAAHRDGQKSEQGRPDSGTTTGDAKPGPTQT